MKISNDYEGSSIEILSYNDKDNSAVLSLRKENGEYSQYYNFFVQNNDNVDGYIYIQNIKLSKYYDKDSIFFPYKRLEGQSTWKRMDNTSFSVQDEQLVIKVEPFEKCEISYVPRYTNENLEFFLSEISLHNNVYITRNLLPKIEIGAQTLPTVFVIGRQHPGETLSSFFIEGMINSVLDNKELKNKYHFVFYPIVNTVGVQTGCHRYVEGVDFNRVWQNSNAPKNIQFIKQELKQYKIKYFIDVHNDEITPIDYIRASGKINKKNIGEIVVLKAMGPLYRLLRSIVKQKKIINLSYKTAREYVRKKYHCLSILVELSMKENYDKANLKGYNFIKNLLLK